MSVFMDEAMCSNRKCIGCGNIISFKSIKNTAEFETIQLGDIFGNYRKEINSSSTEIKEYCTECTNQENPNFQTFTSCDEDIDMKPDIKPDKPYLGTTLKNGISSDCNTNDTIQSHVEEPGLNNNGVCVVAETNKQHSVMDPNLPVSLILPNGIQIRHKELIRYPCLLCNKQFKNPKTIIKHQEKVHSDLARYICHICNGKFTFRGALNSHISISHPTIPSYNCSTCGKSFKKKSYLAAHITILHAQNSRKFKCEICPSAFSKKVNLNYHKKRKHDGENFILNSTSSDMNMNTQESQQNSSNSPVQIPIREDRNSNPSPHHQLHNMQEISSKILSENPTVVAHVSPALLMPTVQQQTIVEKTDGEFKCQFCGRGFLFRNNLKCHLRTHIRDKKFTCEICEKSFIYKESLKNHMLLHSNELPYQCEICGKKFRDRSNRRKHVKNVHKSLLANNPANSMSSQLPSSSSTSSSQPVIPKTQPTPKRRKSKKKDNTDETISRAATTTKGVIVSPKSSTSLHPTPESSSHLNYGHQESKMYSEQESKMYMSQHPHVIVYNKNIKTEYDQESSSQNYYNPYSQCQSDQMGIQSTQLINPTSIKSELVDPNIVVTQSQEVLPPFSLLPPQSLSPETANTTPTSYDSPASPYVIPVSMHANPNYSNYLYEQEYWHQQHSAPPPPHPTHPDPTYHSSNYTQNDHQQPIRVTEGTQLTPQTPYTQSQQYFYSDIQHFDFSQL